MQRRWSLRDQAHVLCGGREAPQGLLSRSWCPRGTAPQLPQQNIGTHSLKTTLLAWTARHQ
eukprot:4403538-Amphidinium_carterae.1